MLPTDLGHTLAHALDAGLWAKHALRIDPDPWQRQLLCSAARQIILNCCRQAGKSTATSVLALHTAIFEPEVYVVVSASRNRIADIVAPPDDTGDDDSDHDDGDDDQG